MVVNKTVLKNSYNVAKTFIESIPATNQFTGAHSIQVGLNHTHSIFNGPCHFQMKDQGENAIVLGGGFQFLTTDKYGPKVWEWITNPNKSPWKVLVSEGIELITDDKGNGKGWIVSNPEVLRRVPFNFQKNFCIMTRSITECPQRFKVWYKLVTEYDVDEVDAYYLCSMFVMFVNSYISYSEIRSGSHWALSDLSQLYNLDWSKFRTGNINKEHLEINGLKVNSFWMSKRTPNFTPFTIDLIKKSTTKKGRFSDSNTYDDVDEILNSFYSWQKKHGFLKTDENTSS